jgi:hypothetical protein
MTIMALDTLAALQAFGYPRRDAEFLRLVALMSGHFLSRQYLTYTAQHRGRAESEFLERLRSRGHVRVAAGTRPRRYQLVGEIYEAAGTSTGAHSKPASLDKSARRILGLDFVLAQRSVEFLPRSADKAAFFRREFGVPEDRFPSAVFGGRGKVGGCTRVFPDQCPVFVERTEQGITSRVGFTYVAEDGCGLRRFRSHLRSYRTLWNALPVPIRLVFVASSDRLFSSAEKHFTAAAGGSSLRTPSFEGYCALRQKYEMGEFAALSADDYVTLADGRKRFADAAYEALYREFSGAAESSGQAASRWSFEGFLGGPVSIPQERRDVPAPPASVPAGVPAVPAAKRAGNANYTRSLVSPEKTQ